MKKKQHSVFDKVVFIGPDLKGNGGIASVLALYSYSFDIFHYLPTNSHKGKVAGYFNFLSSLLSLPFLRIKGRKIVHIHYAGRGSWKRKSIVLQLAKALGYKTIMHCHCDLCLLSRNNGYDNVKRVLKQADVNIALASSFKQFAEKELKLTNIKIVNNPIEVSSYNPRVRSDNSITTFLFLGLLIKEKGCYDIIEAAKILKQRNKEFQITLGGTGYEENVLKELSHKNGLDSYISFTGWIKGDKKRALLEKSHVIILPSYNEAMPMTILEAKSLGKPVISTKVGAVPDILADGENGFLIAVGDVKALAENMEKYIDNPSLLNEHSEASYKSVSSFDINHIKNRLEVIYKSLL